MFSQANNIFPLLFLYGNDHIVCLVCIILKLIWILFHLFLWLPKPMTFFSTFPVWKWSYCVYSMYYFEADLNFISSLPMFTQVNNIFLYFSLYENDHSECLACINSKLIWSLFSSPPMFTQVNNIFLYFSLYENDHIVCLACIILKTIWSLFHLHLCLPNLITFFSTFLCMKMIIMCAYHVLFWSRIEVYFISTNAYPSQ
jgi:hypothetical protein